MNLHDLFRNTDALTYANALKITLADIKREVTEVKDMRDNINTACENIDKLIRKADNQYRLIAKIATDQGSLASELTIENDLADVDVNDNLKTLMEEV